MISMLQMENYWRLGYKRVHGDECVVGSNILSVVQAPGRMQVEKEKGLCECADEAEYM